MLEYVEKTIREDESIPPIRKKQTIRRTFDSIDKEFRNFKDLLDNYYNQELYGNNLEKKELNLNFESLVYSFYESFVNEFFFNKKSDCPLTNGQLLLNGGYSLEQIKNKLKQFSTIEEILDFYIQLSPDKLYPYCFNEREKYLHDSYSNNFIYNKPYQTKFDKLSKNSTIVSLDTITTAIKNIFMAQGYSESSAEAHASVATLKTDPNFIQKQMEN
jgi:hypothetical protein